MGVYLYCVLPADAPDPAVAGLDGERLRALRAGGVCVWVGDVPTAPSPGLARIREHDRVIRSAMDAGLSPVPIRFGQVLADDQALEAHLAANDYRPRLERVRGGVEFGIRILDPASPDDAPAAEPDRTVDATAPNGGTGAAYLRTVAARIHAAEARQSRSLDAAREIDDRLAEWVRESHIEATDQPPGAVVAHLVQADAADAYGTRAHELSHAHGPLRIIVTGPWPPYSFVDR